MSWISLLVFIAVPLAAAALIVLIEISAAVLSKLGGETP